MSADNGIYVAQFPDGFRVIHAQAIDNLNYYPEGTEAWKQELDSYYGNAPRFNTFEEAIKEAHVLESVILQDEFCPILEYGVCNIGYFDYIPKETNGRKNY